MHRLSGGEVSGKVFMTPKYFSNGKEHILYDGGVADKVDSNFFEIESWQRRNAQVGTARGRGAAAFVQGADGEYVLRHYRRGGLIARFSHDCYLWTGLHRSRPWREWNLLVALQEMGLPAPKPIAARLIHQGWCYTADIVTRRLPGETLAQALAAKSISAAVWRIIGAEIRRFHDAGIHHADLNAHNILLNDESVALVDFDRGTIRSPGTWRYENMERLLRSLRKLAAGDVRFGFSEGDWNELMHGYENGVS